jgi:hypothetical protein
MKSEIATLVLAFAFCASNAIGGAEQCPVEQKLPPDVELRMTKHVYFPRLDLFPQSDLDVTVQSFDGKQFWGVQCRSRKSDLMFTAKSASFYMTDANELGIVLIGASGWDNGAAFTGRKIWLLVLRPK